MRAGVSEGIITPQFPALLAGYPLPKDRYHNHVHDDLKVHCLYLENGGVQLGLVCADLGELSKKRIAAMRAAMQAASGIPAQNIAITCSHTHSGPVTTTLPFTLWSDDRELYPHYLDEITAVMARQMANAKNESFEATIAVGKGQCGAQQGVGGNRRSKDGPADPDVLVWAVYEKADDRLRGVFVNYALHPTFLHAESREISADYPGYIYEYFKRDDPQLVVGFTMGASGNQSSRHFRSGQTFDEAKRVGYAIAAEAKRALESSPRQQDPALFARTEAFYPPMFETPGLRQAEAAYEKARQDYDSAVEAQKPYPVQRTLECTLIGAEHQLEIAKAGPVARRIIEGNSPFEIQLMGIGDVRLVFYSCEIFVEYALRLKKQSPYANTVLISCANGGASGYVCTPQAFGEGGYEALWTRYKPETGDMMVDRTLELLREGSA